MHDILCYILISYPYVVAIMAEPLLIFVFVYTLHDFICVKPTMILSRVFYSTHYILIVTNDSFARIRDIVLVKLLYT